VKARKGQEVGELFGGKEGFYEEEKQCSEERGFNYGEEGEIGEVYSFTVTMSGDCFKVYYSFVFV